MKKSCRVLMSLLFTVATILSVFSLTVNAEQEACSLILEYVDVEAGPLEGCTFRLFPIAEGDWYRYQITETFAVLKSEVDSVDWKSGEDMENLASSLSAYITHNEISPTQTEMIDAEGRLTFADLPKGLYLALGEKVIKDGWVYTPQPVLVWLPIATPDGELDYSPVCSLKHDKLPENRPIDISVKKVWVDDGTHPSSVTIRLLCDGEQYDQVTLNEENNWQYVWTDLDDSHDWKIIEVNVPDDYTAKVERIGNDFIVTNTKKLPQTGQLWWPVPLLLASGAILFMSGLILYISDKKRATVNGAANGKK